MRKTKHYKLPLFDSNDQPKWLVDWNEAMAKIDLAIHVATTGDPDVPDITELYGMIQELQTITNNIVSNLYSEYDSTRAYEKNDFCTHNGELYICTEETFEGDPFSNLNWTPLNLTSKITEVLNNITALIESTGFVFDKDTYYAENSFVWHEGRLWKFIYAHEPHTDWNSGEVTSANIGYELSQIISSIDNLFPRMSQSENRITQLETQVSLMTPISKSQLWESLPVEVAIKKCSQANNPSDTTYPEILRVTGAMQAGYGYSGIITHSFTEIKCPYDNTIIPLKSGDPLIPSGQVVLSQHISPDFDIQNNDGYILCIVADSSMSIPGSGFDVILPFFSFKTSTVNTVPSVIGINPVKPYQMLFFRDNNAGEKISEWCPIADVGLYQEYGGGAILHGGAYNHVIAAKYIDKYTLQSLYLNWFGDYYESEIQLTPSFSFSDTSISFSDNSDGTVTFKYVVLPISAVL